ncbi:MAG: dienelactone hydrolase family protein [Chthoniobacterales bacterium]
MLEKLLLNFNAEVFRHKNFDLNYRVFNPEKPQTENTKYPLILFLHGAGERGSDNTLQLRHGVEELLDFTLRKKSPAIILAPQCPLEAQWVDVAMREPKNLVPEKPSQALSAVFSLLDKLLVDLPVDSHRLYITGLSMGGFGTWDTLYRKPDIFAGAIAICGGGDPATAPNVSRTPVQVFHGGADPIILPSRSREMVEAVRKAGGRITYTEYPAVNHDSWTQTYHNDEVLDWLFSQRRFTP